MNERKKNRKNSPQFPDFTEILKNKIGHFPRLVYRNPVY